MAGAWRATRSGSGGQAPPPPSRRFGRGKSVPALVRSPRLRPVSSRLESQLSTGSRPLSFCRREVDLAAFLAELLAHLRHPSFGGQERLRARILLRREVPHLLGDLHAAEFRSAHRAEMRRLGALRRQGLVVILLGGVG